MGLVELVALERVGADAAETIFVGDTPSDTAAAKRAKAWAQSPFARAAEDAADADPFTDAIAIYDGPAELASRLDDFADRGWAGPAGTWWRRALRRSAQAPKRDARR